MSNLKTNETSFILESEGSGERIVAIPRSGCKASLKGDYVLLSNMNESWSLDYKKDTLDGNLESSSKDLFDKIINLFLNGGDSGNGAVESVTGGLVDSTDPKNPTVDLPTGGSATTFLSGDKTWKTPTNTTYSVIAEAEASTGTAATGRVVSAASLKRDILNRTKTFDGLTELSSNAVLSRTVHVNRNKPIVCTGGSPIQVEIPVYSTAAASAWQVGDEVYILNNHGATLQITPNSGVNLSSQEGMRVVASAGWCRLTYITANQWLLTGSLIVVD